MAGANDRETPSEVGLRPGHASDPERARPEICVVASEDLSEEITRALGPPYKTWCAPRDIESSELAKLRFDVAVVELPRGREDLGVGVAVRIARGTPEGAACICLTERKSVAPLLRANRSMGLDFMMGPPYELVELEFRVERALTNARTLRWAQRLQASVEAIRAPQIRVRAARERAGREYLELLLDEARGSVREAAELGGLEKETFERLMRRYRVALPEPSRAGCPGRR